MKSATAALVVLLLIPLTPLSAGPVTLEESWSRGVWGSVEALAWNSRGDRLAVGTGTGSLFLLSRTGTGLWTKGLGSTVTSLVWAGSKVVVSTSSGLVRAYSQDGAVAWSVDLGDSVSELAPGSGVVVAAVGPELATIDLASGQVVESVRANGTVSHAALIENGSVFSVGSELFFTGENLSKLAELDSEITCLAASPGGLLAAGSVSGMIAVLREEDILTLKVASSSIRDLAWGPTNLLAVGSADGAVRIVTPSGEEVWSGSLGSGVTDLEWAPDGSLLAVGGQDGDFLVITPTGAEVFSTKLGEAVSSLAWSPDSSALAVGTWSVRLLVKVSPTISISNVEVDRYGSNATITLSVSPSLTEPVLVQLALREDNEALAQGETMLSGSGGSLSLELIPPLSPGPHVLTLLALVEGEVVASQVVEVEVLPRPPEEVTLSAEEVDLERIKVRAELSPAPDPRWPLPAKLVVSESGQVLAEAEWSIGSGIAERTLQIDLEPGVHDLLLELTYDERVLANARVTMYVYSASIDVNASSRPGRAVLTGEVRVYPPPGPGSPLEAQVQISEYGDTLETIPLTIAGEVEPFEAELSLEPGVHELVVSLIVAGSPASSQELIVEVPKSRVGAALAIVLTASAGVGAAVFTLRLRRARIEELKVRALEAALNRGGRVTAEELASTLRISPSLARKVLDLLKEEGALEEM